MNKYDKKFIVIEVIHLKSSENKMGISIILTVLMVGLLITSSFILLLQFKGAEKLMYTLNSLGIIKSMDKESKELKEEIEEFPYICVISNSDKSTSVTFFPFFAIPIMFWS